MQISSQRPTTAAAQAAPASRTTPATSIQATTRLDVELTEAQPSTRSVGASSPDQTASNLARLDSFAEAAMARLQNAVADAPEGEVTSFREAAEALESGLSRLRAGLQNGTITPEDAQRGVRNTFEYAREALDAARPTSPTVAAASTAASATAPEAGVAVAAPETSGLSETAEAVRSGYQGVTDSLLAGADNLQGLDESVMDAVGESVSAFESATARLDQALFNPVSGDPIDRGTFRDLYTDALSQLQTQLTELIGGPNKGGSMASVLYDAQKAVEGMDFGSFGLDVDG